MHEYSLEYYGTCTLVFHLCIVGLYIQQLIVLIFIIIFCRKMGQKFIFKSYVYHMQAQFILIIILAFQNILPRVDVAEVECVEGSWAGELYCHND